MPSPPDPKETRRATPLAPSAPLDAVVDCGTTHETPGRSVGGMVDPGLGFPPAWAIGRASRRNAARESVNARRMDLSPLTDAWRRFGYRTRSHEAGGASSRAALSTTLNFDGACEPENPGGVAAYGFLVRQDGRTLKEGYGVAAPPGPGATNNVGEYRGLIEGLRWLGEHGHGGDDIVVRGDSQLIIRQVLGEYRVKDAKLKPLHQETLALLTTFARPPRFEWVRREENERADELSKEGVRVAFLEHPEWARLKGAPARPARAEASPAAGERAGDGATQKQLDYLRALGVTPPAGVSKRDASTLIDDAKRKRDDPH